MLGSAGSVASAARRGAVEGWRRSSCAPVVRATAQAPAARGICGGSIVTARTRAAGTGLRVWARSGGAAWLTAAQGSRAVHAPAVATHRVSSGVEPPKDSVGRLFAVVRLSGTQYKVTEGDVVVTDRIDAEVGSTISLDDVLLVGSRHKTVVGRPVVPDASVTALVEEQTLDAKVLVFKKKRRKGYKKTQGHRRQITVLRVQGVECAEAADNATTVDVDAEGQAAQ